MICPTRPSATSGHGNLNPADSYPYVGDKLANTMNQNPYMKVLVLGGRCDLACPIDNIHYVVDHMQLDANYRTNITYAQFDAGHMMYINLPDLQKNAARPGEFRDAVTRGFVSGGRNRSSRQKRPCRWRFDKTCFAQINRLQFFTGDEIGALRRQLCQRCCRRK